MPGKTRKASVIDVRGALVPQPRWCSWLDAGPPPDPPAHRDAFVLRVDGGAATIEATAPSGHAYAEYLAAQLTRLHPAGIPDLVVVDWPDLDVRGVMLDCSRHRVLTVETLEAWFAVMGELRVNHVELYLETTLAHHGHEDVWGPRGGYSFDDVARLRLAAAQHHIELIGQQNALGHLEGWLATPRFAGLAALPGGYTTPDGAAHEPPATVEPTNPDAWALVAELVTNMAAAFDASPVHVGLDEPIDLNPAVWDAIFDVPGAPIPWASVDNGSFCVPLPPERLDQYADWIQRLRALPALDGREMVMWADVVAPHPELLDRIPDDVTLVEWGYEADHAFDARCARIAQAGRRFWVAPGTSGWSAIGGRLANMRANVDAALEAAAAHGAAGLLMTSWGANPSISDWPGYVWAAAGAWNRDRRPHLDAALDLAVIGSPDPGLGEVWTRLGTVSDLIEPTIPEASSVSEMFRSGGMAGIGLALMGMTVEQLDAVDAALREAAQLLANVAASVERDELAWVGDALRWGSAAARRRLEWSGALDATALREAHRRLCDEHRRLWDVRNRPEGYDSVARELAATAGRF